MTIDKSLTLHLNKLLPVRGAIKFNNKIPYLMSFLLSTVYTAGARTWTHTHSHNFTIHTLSAYYFVLTNTEHSLVMDIGCCIHEARHGAPTEKKITERQCEQYTK